MKRRAVIGVIAGAAAMSLVCLGLLIVLVRVVLHPSWVSVVNRSGFPLEEVSILATPDHHSCAHLPVGQAFTVRVAPSDSQPVDLSFRCQGIRRDFRDCGNIGALGEERTVTVLPGGAAVDINFGGAVPCVIEGVPGK